VGKVAGILLQGAVVVCLPPVVVTECHLQVVGVGEWQPTSTLPAWNAEPRLPPGQEDS
jgi:hypothetical protein